jgi:ADP-ribose pyrophosphatase YjhB (NUDIX family)
MDNPQEATVADKDALAGRGRSLEEEYFYRREQELIQKLRQRGEEEASRRRLAEKTGVADQEILDDLLALGYTPDTLRLLHLVPLVQMAWAEGSVSDGERELIVQAARTHGVDQGSDADRMLAGWLSERPSEAFFEKTLRAVAAILNVQPPEEREASQRDLLSYCSAIASASGGVLGFGKVSEDERQVLARITRELERHRASAPHPSRE